MNGLASIGVFVLPGNAIKNEASDCNLQVETLLTFINNKGEFSFGFSSDGKTYILIDNIKPFDFYKIYYTNNGTLNTPAYVSGYSLRWLLNNYTNQSVAVGINKGIIASSIFTLGSSSELVPIVFASVDIVVASGNLYIISEQEELAKTPEGKAFVEAWNDVNKYVAITQGATMLYGITRNIIAYKLAVTELKTTFNTWKVKDLEELRAVNPKLATKLESFGTTGIKKLEDLIAEYELQVQKITSELKCTRILAEEILQSPYWDKWLDDLIKLKKDNYFETLSSSFQTRYGKLVDALKNETNVANLSVLQEQLNIANQIKSIRKAIDPNNIFQLGDRNILYGKIELNYGGKAINENVIVISGPQSSLSSIPKDVSINGTMYKIITESDFGQAYRNDWSMFSHDLTYRSGSAANDCEIKLFKYATNKVRTEIGVSLSNNPELFKQISGKIEITSEMNPCPSCTKVINQQALNFFGKNVLIEPAAKIPHAVKID